MDCEGIPGQENKLILHRTDSCLNFKVHVAMSSSQAFQWHFTKYTFLGQLYFLQIPYFLQNYHFHKTLRSNYLSTWYRQSGYDDCLQGVRVEEVTISIVGKSENNHWYLLLISNHWYLFVIFLITVICYWYCYWYLITDICLWYF